MTSLFARGVGLPGAQRAEGCWIIDTAGNRYLDGASGALVVNLGHNDSRVNSAILRQLDAVAYVHSTAFNSDVLEEYASLLASKLPMDDPTIYPVSGGSEAVETALKVARAFHLANDEPERTVFIGRELSYHGNTVGALDVSGRQSLRDPYLPWLGRAGRVPGVLEYRCPNPGHPQDCAEWHAHALQAEIERVGPAQVAAFIAEPIGGAASGAAMPPAGYWDAVVETCRRHGILVIADEVMTGFGRTGEWFASEHFGLQPDIMTMAKGASSGYWPLGVCAMSRRVSDTLEDTGFVHGFTFSHHMVGAVTGRAVIKRLDELRLVERAEERGFLLGDALTSLIGESHLVGDVRGIGLLWAVEIVEDRSQRTPFPAAQRMAARLTRAARAKGLLVYPSTGCAGGGTGDLIMVGPPLVVSEPEIETLADRLAAALKELE